MIEVVPEQLGVEQLQFALLVAQQLAHPPIVKQDASVFVDHAHRRRAEVQNFVKLALLLDDLRLVLDERGDVVNPQHALAAGKADVPTLIGDLHVGQQQMKRPAALGPPDYALVDELAAAFAQRLDDPRALLDVVPEQPGLDELKLILLVSEHFAQPRVVEQQPPVLVDDAHRRRAKFQNLAELPFLLGNLGTGRAAAVRRRQTCRVGRHAAPARYLRRC